MGFGEIGNWVFVIGGDLRGWKRRESGGVRVFRRWFKVVVEGRRESRRSGIDAIFRVFLGEFELGDFEERERDSLCE